ncbi:MAG: MarR family transcriptional regulator [Paracoccus sp. (in: a-proteobacteria)]|nr:MarR family transcriptional regulator [Paracoccus sp. (in: a-proteobacteria)]
MTAGPASPPTPDTKAKEAMSKARLRMWVRLLGVTRRTEAQLREFLRLNHDATLPRFDVLAALYRRESGITMTELSRMLLVSNGNTTAVVDRLEKDGLASRSPSATDRRTTYVTLTPAGRLRFDEMAREHSAEIDRIFAALDSDEIELLTRIFKRIGATT